jgi:uncharacterized protein (TIGR00251 family)
MSPSGIEAGNGVVKVIVKPNSRKDMLLGYDEARGAYRIAIAAPPEKGKANASLLKFVKKITGRRCEIISGSSSREKLLRLL